MFSELNRLFSGQSGQIVQGLVLLSLAYFLALDLLLTPDSISWMIMKATGMVFIVLFAIFDLWPRSKDLWEQFDAAYGSYLSLVLALGFLAWGVYLGLSGSDDVLFLVVSFGAGLWGLADFIRGYVGNPR